MNNDVWQGKWTHWKGRLKQKWGALTDDDLMQIEGNKDAVIGRLQERYGRTKDVAEREWREFCKVAERAAEAD